MDYLPQETAQPEPYLRQLAASGNNIRVYDVEQQKLIEMDLEQYLIGVVAAEMPASFGETALEAQAVAARTFAANRIAHPNAKVQELDPQAQITTSPNICQAWISQQEQENRWGQNYATYHNKIVQAVDATRGQVLTWQGQLAEPLYHASCGGGSTEAAVNVWGNEVPYLTSVTCNHPADKHSGEETVFTLADFSARVGADTSAVPAGAFQDYITVLARTAAQRVQEIRIGDTVLTGGQLRTALGLKSSQFTYRIDDGKITFTTEGYGHGVGMCQYGADYYAKQGYSCQEILQHYYPGTELQQMNAQK